MSAFLPFLLPRQECERQLAFLYVILRSFVFICFVDSVCADFTKIFILRNVRNPLHNTSCFKTYISRGFLTLNICKILSYS